MTMSGGSIIEAHAPRVGAGLSRLVIIGCGAMGMAAAFAIATTHEEVQLRLVDRDAERLKWLRGWLLRHVPKAIVECSHVDIENEDGDIVLANACAGADAIGLALPWSPTRRSLPKLVHSKVPIASITRPDYAEVDEIGELATRAGCCVLLPIGLEPGLTEILAVEAARQVSKLEALAIRCGGFPAKPIPPLNHTVLFGGRLSVAPRPAYAVEGSQLTSLSRFDGLESVNVEGIGTLEAHHDGMLPWLPADAAIRGAAEISQKTLRWPGYAEIIRLLLRLGLLSDTLANVDGAQVSPRRVVEQVLSVNIGRRKGDADITVLRVDARGRDERDVSMGVRLQCLDHSDPETGLSSMARLTGFTLAIALQMLAEGTIAGTGLLRPHEAFRGSLTQTLLNSLRARGIVFTQVYAL
jgi:lysine 6-dehydrogenase